MQYWEDLDEPDFPVTASINQDIREVLGYDQPNSPAAGNVVISPDMEILGIRGGHDNLDHPDQWAFDLIMEHMAEN